MITIEELKTFFFYDPETGIFRSRAARRGMRQAVGSIVGWVSNDGYQVINFNYRHYLAHRLAWLWVVGEWPSIEIDHKNGNRLDNRISNLRLANRTQNAVWSKLRKNNTSGFRGVRWMPNRQKWVARIKVNYRYIHLGCYTNKEQAAKAYDCAAKKHFGEFAKTNQTVGCSNESASR